CYSVQVAFAAYEPQRMQQEYQVEAQGPALDVVEVVLDALLDRRAAAPAVDLRPSGDAGLHLVAQHVAGDAPPELLDERRSLGARPDQAHVTAQHVEELRQLVEAEAPQHGAERRAPRLGGGRP